MSLINQMLDDLEERQARLAGDEDAILAGLSAVSDQNFHTFQRRRLIGLGCLAAVTVSLLVYYVNPIRISPAEFTALFRVTSSKVSSTGEAMAKSAAMPAAIPVQINAADNGSVSTTQPTAVRIELTDNNNIPDLNEYLSLDLQLGTLDALRSKLLANVPVEDNDEPAGTTYSEPARINHILTEAGRFSSNITIQLSREVEYQVYPLTDPHRIVVELDEYLLLPADFSRRYDDGLIQAVRGHHEQDYWTIIVLDVASPAAIDRAEIVANHSVYELIIEISAADEVTEDPSPESNGLVNELSVQSTATAPVTEPSQQLPSFNRVVVSADNIYKKGLQLYRLGKVVAGLEQILRAVNLEPHHIQPRTTLATYLVDQGNQELALAVLQKGLELHPAQFDWARLKAHLLVERNDINGAVNTLQNELPELQKDPDYHAFLAALLQRQGRYEEAVRYYREIVQVRPSNGIWWMGLGISLEKSEQLQDANYAYEKALSDHTLDAELRGYINKRIMILSRR